MADDRDDDYPQEEGEKKVVKKKRTMRRCDVKIADMPAALLSETIEIANAALDDHRLHKDVATAVKRALDEKMPRSTWHCIVGQHFGSNITHDAGRIANFYLDRTAFLVFGTGPETQDPGEAGQDHMDR
eukprot:283980_1